MTGGEAYPLGTMLSSDIRVPWRLRLSFSEEKKEGRGGMEGPICVASRDVRFELTWLTLKSGYV